MKVVHGIRPNLAQHGLLVASTAFVGAMVGLERTVVPLLAREEFGVGSAAVSLSFIASFGAVKALANFAAGRIADRLGRKRLLVGGWIVGLPVPLLVVAAPSWGWVVAANALLGLNQGLTWTMTLTMQSDLAGGRRRGLALGANEFAGYVAMGVAAAAAGRVAASYGLRPAPFAIGAFAALSGLALAVGVRESAPHARADGEPVLSPGWILVPRVRGRGRALAACYQAGLVTKVNDAGVWGLLPLLLAARGVSVARIGWVAATYPVVWGVTQAVTGAASDQLGRRRLIVAGLLVQGAGLATLLASSSVAGAFAAGVVLGVGTALVYPTLLAAVADLAGPAWRASAMGAYRFWRDLGLAVGALGTGVVADAAGVEAAVAGAALLSAASALLVARMFEDVPPG